MSGAEALKAYMDLQAQPMSGSGPWLIITPDGEYRKIDGKWYFTPMDQIVLDDEEDAE